MSAPPGRRSAVLALGVIAIALNLRAAVASVGPVLERIEADLHLSSTGAAVLTAIPVLLFGLAAGSGPYLSRRLGVRGALAALLAAICAGLALRTGPDAFTLFAGTALAAVGIAGANVLLPAVIKHDFPRRTGLMMGLYTVAVTSSAAAAAGLTVPIGRALGAGWRPALGFWAVPAGAALLGWLPLLRDSGGYGLDFAPAWRRLLGNRLAWLVTGYFGMQSLVFYSVLEWLPSLYESHGYSPTLAGAWLSLSTIAQLPAALTLPALATRMRHQGPLIVASTLFTIGGLTGVLIAPTAAAPLWAVVLGLGQGSAFPLALTLLVLRGATARETAQLSAMAQTVGYLIAAIGPALIGALHAASGGWRWPVGVLIAVSVPQGLVGFRGGAPGYVSGLTGRAPDPPSPRQPQQPQRSRGPGQPGP